MSKLVCVLYDDPVDGYPKSYPRDDIPKFDHYPDGQTLPTPKAIDFKPGALLGSVSGELGLRKFLETQGHTLVVTSDKDGMNSTLDKELPDTEIVISQPFWPAYMTAERIAKAPRLRLMPRLRNSSPTLAWSASSSLGERVETSIMNLPHACRLGIDHT